MITRQEFIRRLKKEFFTSTCINVKKLIISHRLTYHKSAIGPGISIFSSECEVMESDDSKNVAKNCATELLIVNLGEEHIGF